MMHGDSVTMIASGDLRLSANQNCWPEQEKVEAAVVRAVEDARYQVRRGHPYDERKGHGFIDSQHYGRQVFRDIPPESPLIVVCAAWQYSHHVLHGLFTHRGPILTVANWSGTWPGLVGMLNLNGSMTKAGISYSSLWSEDFTDEYFLTRLTSWLEFGVVGHDAGHARRVDLDALPPAARDAGGSIAARLRREKAIMGVFDEGCMGMFNAIIPDHLLNPTGIFKERLSQSALYFEATRVADTEAREAFRWLVDRGMTFRFGPLEEEDLTERQVLEQLKMYIAAVRIAHDFGCDLLGIQYQQGLKDLMPASDLAEGLLNNRERPPVRSRDGASELYSGEALPHFNEVDECAGVDALVTNRVWSALGLDPETTLHDLRWGDSYDGKFVWVFEISGAAPPHHFEGGYAGAVSERQPPMYFRLGGGTLKGVSRPGEIVWSRVFVEEGKLKADVGRGRAVSLPKEETERRWRLTTSQWPIMHAILYGVTRDQMMARHKANHVQVAYARDDASADAALAAKAAAFEAMGIETYICGGRGETSV